MNKILLFYAGVAVLAVLLILYRRQKTRHLDSLDVLVNKKSDYISLRCSFCNKDQRDVKTLIAGPNVYICDECADICVDIAAEKFSKEQQKEPDTPAAPERRTCSLCFNILEGKQVDAFTAKITLDPPTERTPLQGALFEFMDKTGASIPKERVLHFCSSCADLLREALT